MSESQQGPEICDVISAKRYLQPFGQEMFLAMNFIGISTLKGKWRLYLDCMLQINFFEPLPPLKEGKRGLIWCDCTQATIVFMVSVTCSSIKNNEKHF